jgi:hypothetical protein
MARLEDALTGGSMAGLAAGIGTAMLAPLVLPAINWVVRPVARLAVVTGVQIYRGTVAPVGAAMADLVSEARAELASAEGRPRDAAAGGAVEERAAGVLPRRGAPKRVAEPQAAAGDARAPRRTARPKGQRKG